MMKDVTSVDMRIFQVGYSDNMMIISTDAYVSAFCYSVCNLNISANISQALTSPGAIG